jgi:MoaA/NifB/PqqE/SkfB family radical SAM enzyme
MNELHTVEKLVPLGRPRFDAATTPPSWLHLTMSTSSVCNYRCRHCHIWMHKDPDNKLTTEQRVDVVRQFAKFGGPHGTVAIPGGEVMMDLPELLAITAACKEAGLQCVVNSNGSYVTDENVARTIVESGITRLCISLDSHVPELHNYTRGLQTAYRETLRAIRLLVAARDQWNPSFFLSVSCVVFDRNLELLGDFVEFCRGLGVNRADFQLLSQTFSNAHPSRDVFWESHFFHTPEAKAHAIEVLTRVIDAHQDGFLQKSRHDLGFMIDYLNGKEFRTEEPICASHERNFIVNTNGEVALCHNSWGAMPDAPYIGNLGADGTLVDIWTGARAQIARKVMDQCTLGCGALNCHRR